ncbi:MAG TPA: dihydrofolate reductase family protein [Micromonosporaceae bacterium]
MRKIVSGLFISLDGVVSAPDTWHFPYFNEEMGQAVQDQMADADAMLLGRRTYAEFAAYWPNHPSDVPPGDYMNHTEKFVASSTLDKVEWSNSTLLRGDLVQELTRLKAQPGRNINVVGSPTLVRFLLRERLLDQLNLLVHPLVVGAGDRLFDGIGAEVPLRLARSQTFSTGVLYLNYEPAQ